MTNARSLPAFCRNVSLYEKPAERPAQRWQAYKKHIDRKALKCYYIICAAAGADRYRGIAQLVEQRSPKPRAEGSNPSTPARKYRVSTSDTRYFCFQNRSTTLIFTLIGTKYPYFMTESRRIGKFRRFFYAFFSMLVSKNFCILLALSRFICSVAWTYRCKVKAAVA